MSRNYEFAPGEYYHVYARGFEKSKVFLDGADYERFIEGLYLLNSSVNVNIRDVKLNIIRGLTSDRLFVTNRGKTLVDIGAYCLMPNHFHILLHEKEEKCISKFMQKLMTSYTMYFNKRYERTGALFGSSFKAKHIVDDRHLKYLFAYIHLNPKSLKSNKQLENYEYSSYQDYLKTKREQASILNARAFPDYFEGDMLSEIGEWLSVETKELLPEV